MWRAGSSYTRNSPPPRQAFILKSGLVECGEENYFNFVNAHPRKLSVSKTKMMFSLLYG
jgi:hypothetical protein